MAIRDTWHRMVRKSDSSSSSSTTARSDDGDEATTTPSGTSPTPGAPAPKASSRLAGNLSKITSWRLNAPHATKDGGSGDSSSSSSSSGGGSSKAFPKRGGGGPPPKSILKRPGGGGGGGGGSSAFGRRRHHHLLHPSERPLTEQNLRHQEMLGTFTMKFGRSRRPSRGAGSSVLSGISPRCSIDSASGGEDGEDGGYLARVGSAAVAPDEARIAEESS